MTLHKLIAFDLDDTLAPSKSPLDERMSVQLRRLLDVADVCVISGGQIAQFQAQVIDRLETASPDQLSRLHLMPTCGTQYYRYEGDSWQRKYAQELSPEVREHAIKVVEETARELGYWESDTWGPIMEDRGSQVTFSALGQAAPVAAKQEWDPTGAKKNALRDAVQDLLPELEVRSGGSTSIDITKRGIDKAYGMERLAEVTGFGLDDMLFVGDRLDEHGNDYPVKRLGVQCIAVTKWEDTLEVIDELIERVEVAGD
ncbi:HAD-IIB family hydrolase [Agromyces sp. MMS24-K17]|uniref:HAD-IIB family hydrolase n=1 Tax=Agromyces sp. MMS24-K17 TaxID=3372850 RepID=UPI0037542046